MVELVDAPDSKSGSARSVGSIPTTRTTVFLLSLCVSTLCACQSGWLPTEDLLATMRQRFAGDPHGVFIVNRSKFAAIYRTATVAFAGGEAPGTLIVDTPGQLL